MSATSYGLLMGPAGTDTSQFVSEDTQPPAGRLSSRRNVLPTQTLPPSPRPLNSKQFVPLVFLAPSLLRSENQNCPNDRSPRAWQATGKGQKQRELPHGSLISWVKLPSEAQWQEAVYSTVTQPIVWPFSAWLHYYYHDKDQHFFSTSLLPLQVSTCS